MPEPANEDCWFRYENSYSYDRNHPGYQLERLPILSRTSRGVWLNWYGQKKFCLTKSRKKFAYPTVELAFDSYVIRRTRQKQYLERDLAKVNILLELAKANGAIERAQIKSEPITTLLDLGECF